MRIVILGAPGAGKGTQCKRVVAEYGLAHLSSGDILRRERSEGTELGKEAQSYMDSGALVPDEVIVKMMASAVSESVESGFVLDGFPRTVNQAQELDNSLQSSGQKIDAIINLNVDDELVSQRMTGRRSCPECGAVYHIENLKPKVEGKCDNDDADLVQRADDALDVVANRLKTYHEQTKPVVGYYKSNGTVIEIDANKDADEVTGFVLDKLEELASALK